MKIRKLSLYELLEQKRMLAGDGVLFTPADACEVSSDHEMEIEVDLNGAGPESGEFEFEIECEDGSSQVELEVEIEDAKPNSEHEVAVDGVVVGILVVGEDGEGKMELTGEELPEGLEIRSDSEITVGEVLSANLADASIEVEAGDDDKDDDKDEDEDEDEDNDDELEEGFFATLAGDGPEHGKAEFEIETEDDSIEIELEVEIEDAEPGSIHEVAVDGVVVGSIKVDAKGNGKLEIESEDHEIPDEFPNVGSGSVVTVGSILSGEFVDVGETADVNGDEEVDAEDVDADFAAVRAESADLAHDVDQDGDVDNDDAATLLDVVFDSAPGDANLDGVFDSADLVIIFQSGLFEADDDDLDDDAGWAQGDWNGDGEFNTADLVYAFQFGNYQA